MSQTRRRLLVILCVALLVPASLLTSLWLHDRAKYPQSKIIDFHPANFAAKADGYFFYSIGDELRNSNELNPDAPTLLRGEIKESLVSPDGRKIAVVANHQLTIVDRENSVVRDVAAVASIYKEPKPIGQSFYRDDDFQWSKDSKNLYFIKDEYYESKGSQLFSEKGELWKLDVETGETRLVLKPFRAYTYFFGRNNGIYFSVPTAAGDLQLEYFDGSRVRDVGSPNVRAFRTEELLSGSNESPFFSFSILDYEKSVLARKAVSLDSDWNAGRQRLEIAGRTYVTLARGKSFKGAYFCSDTLRSVFLPGDRYFLFNVPYCENYSGQLLIDTQTGAYRELPPNTRVYLTTNTETSPHYRITSEGMLSE